MTGKRIIVHDRAADAMKKAPRAVSVRFRQYFLVLKEEGRLAEPDAKKIRGTSLYEMRVRIMGAWRGFYAYVGHDCIVILNIFQKKSSSTPRKEIKTATNHLRDYL